ncbi:hypothetical protein BJX63DRAFT_430109 [Aspergillus granulosus]|uniref:Uncharacterized protein n=1 Tax=Aspergillus granulosus TaxID=176169 RepID=A0ABR4HML7_9EURO
MDPKALAIRKACRRKLAAIYRSPDRFDVCLTPCDLEKIAIQQIPMTLEEDNRPEFIARYAAPVDKPNIDTLEDYITLDEVPFCSAMAIAGYLSNYFDHVELPESDSNPAGADWGDFNFGDLVDLTMGRQWLVHTTWHMESIGAPHMVVMMYNEMEEPNGLFHGEIKTAICVMHGRLKDPELPGHVFAPVLLFSAIGKHHLRIIEAYHNGEHLVMRTTQPFDMTERNDDLFIELSRWRLGGPASKSTKIA